MNRRPRLSTVAVLTLALTGVIAPVAHADPPTREVETLPIVESDPPVLDCDGRTVEFTSGDVTFTSIELPSGRFVATIQLSDVEASDGEITYQVRGLGVIQGTEDEGSFRLNLTLVGPDGQFETVRSTETLRNGEETTTERGSCSVDFL